MTRDKYLNENRSYLGMPEYKIRVRQRYESSPPVGISGEWTEYQIVHGRKIVKRCGTEREAEVALARLLEESSK